MNIPDNFKLVTDKDYVICQGDKYYFNDCAGELNNCMNAVGTSYDYVLTLYPKLTLFRKIQNKPKNKKTETPAGFELVKDYLNYELQTGDKITDDGFSWTTIGGWTGYTIKRLNKEGQRFIAAATEKITPRFISEKPFPHGY